MRYNQTLHSRCPHCHSRKLSSHPQTSPSSFLAAASNEDEAQPCCSQPRVASKQSTRPPARQGHPLLVSSPLLATRTGASLMAHVRNNTQNYTPRKKKKNTQNYTSCGLPLLASFLPLPLSEPIHDAVAIRSPASLASSFTPSQPNQPTTTPSNRLYLETCVRLGLLI